MYDSTVRWVFTIPSIIRLHTLRACSACLERGVDGEAAEHTRTDHQLNIHTGRVLKPHLPNRDGGL